MEGWETQGLGIKRLGEPSPCSASNYLFYISEPWFSNLHNEKAELNNLLHPPFAFY